MKFYCEEAGRALAELKSTPDGLTDAEAARRLAEKGPNKLAEGKKVTTLQRFLQQLSDPMIIILLVAAAVSGVTAAYSGESFADVFIILIVVLINAVLGVYQESKAEKAIEALQEMTAATSKVIRGGKQVSLKSEELVPGDVVVLEAGDAVPADGRILESASIKAEEAALTAEAMGNRVTRLYDVGVAGLHRLLSKLDVLMSARCVVAVAGMEGALASVVGGLVDCPVIAVPTSVGYGASFHGLSALLSMLNSCASGSAVVNIDNGFGAGYLASMINQMEGLPSQEQHKEASQP